MGGKVLHELKTQQGSVLILCLIVLLISLQCWAYFLEVFIDLQACLIRWNSFQKTKNELLIKAKQWHRFDFHWQDLGQYACIVICQPDCKGTHHGLVSLHLNDWTLLIRVARPVNGLQCTQKNFIRLTNDMMYYRFKRS